MTTTEAQVGDEVTGVYGITGTVIRVYPKGDVLIQKDFTSTETYLLYPGEYRIVKTAGGCGKTP